MKKIWLVFSILIISLYPLLSQNRNGIDTNFYVYPLFKYVDNEFDSTFYGEVYRMSVSQIETSKEKLINNVLQDPKINKYLLKNPNYISDFRKRLSNPEKLSYSFEMAGIYLYYDGVTIFYRDTSFHRIDYENAQKRAQSNVNLSKTKIKWSLDDFKTIPLNTSMYEMGRLVKAKTSVTKESIKDGHYVMYYEPIYDNETRTFLTNIPFCYFKIENHLPNGKAVFLSHLGDTLAQGGYLDGKQDGKWEIKLPCQHMPKATDVTFSKLYLDGSFVPDSLIYNYNNKLNLFPLDYDYDWCEYELNYIEGQLNGDFVFRLNKKVRSIGLLHNNKPISNWKFYYENGQLANAFTLRKKPLEIDKNIVYPMVNNSLCDTVNAVEGLPVPPKCIGILPIGNDYSKLLGLADGFFERKSNEYHSRLDNFVFFSASFVDFFASKKSNQTLLTIGLFEAYYENGQEFFKMEISEEGKLLSFSPTVYNEEGSRLSKWYFNKNRTKAIVVDYINNEKFITEMYLEGNSVLRIPKNRLPKKVYFWDIFN